MIDVELSDELKLLGLALGLLRRAQPDDPESLTLNSAFFADPGGTLAGILHEPVRRAAAFDLVAVLLGEAAKTLDSTSTPAGATWVPLIENADGGLYVVVEVGDEDDVRLSAACRGVLAGEGVTLGGTVLLPIAEVGAAGGARLMPGTVGGAIRVAVGVELGAGIAEVSVDGAAVEVVLPTMPGVVPSLRVRLTGLRLPAWPDPRDLVLSDDLDEVGRELIELVQGLLQSRSGLGDEAAVRLRALLALLGLGDRAGIPPLPLAGVFEDGPVALSGWLNQVVTGPGSLVAWLETLAELVGVDLPDGLGGSGTPADPLRFCVRPVDGVEVCLRVTVRAESGATVVTPGLSASARIGVAALPAEVHAEVDLAAITVGGGVQVAWLPAAGLHARLGTAAVPLLDRAGNRVEVLRAGFAAGVDHRPVLVLAADGVTLAGHAYPTLDLSSVDALTEAAGTVASNALVDALTLFLDDDRRARALMALLGLGSPVNPAGGWAVPLPTVAEVMGDPLGALGRYHRRAVAAGRWDVLAAELAALLAAVPPAGTGTPDDPWMVRPAAPTVEFGLPEIGVAMALWTTDGTRLHAGARIAAEPIRVSAGVTVTIAGTIELVRAELPTTGAPTLTFADRARLSATAGDNLVLPGEQVQVALRRLTVTAGWERWSGWSARAELAGATVTAAGATIELPDPYPLAIGAVPQTPAADQVWHALELVLGQAMARGELRTLAAALLGWLPSAGAGVLTPDDDGPPLDMADLIAVGWPALNLKLLVADPAAALRTWVAELLGSGAGHVAMGLLTKLIAGLSGAGRPGLAGAGTYASPWRLPIAEQADLLAWLEPDGPSLSGLDDLVAALVPADITAAAAGTGPAPDPDRLLAVLTAAARFDSGLAEILAGRPDAADGLRRLRDLMLWTDGLLPARAQVAEGDTLAPVTLTAAHGDAPAAFVLADVLPGTDPARVLYVGAALPGVLPWPGQTATIDLTEPGAPPEAFDLNGITAAGPWFATLPPRAAAPGGLTGLTARLRRVVAAITARTGSSPILVAHSVAAHAARAVWAEGVTGGLVTVAAPAGPAETEAPGDAVWLLRDLLDRVPASTAGLAPLRGLAATLGTAFRDGPAARYPADDLVPPPLPPGAGAPVAVVAVLGPDRIDRALATLVRALAGGVRDTLTAGGRAAPNHLGLGLGLRVPVGSDEVRLAVDVRADIQRIRLSGADAAEPSRLRVSVTAGRDGGWLVGDPGRVGGAPAPIVRARLARFDVGYTPATGRTTVAVVLFDAAYDGQTWGRLAITGGTLDAAARALLRAVAAEMPAEMLDLLTALGLVTTAPVMIDADAAERLLVDPAGYLAARAASGLAATGWPAAAGRLLGLTTRPADGMLVASLGAGFELRADPIDRTISLATTADIPIDGVVTVGATGHVTAEIAASPVVLIGNGPVWTAKLRPSEVELFPAPDVARLRTELMAVAGGELARLALTWIRGQADADGLLRALDLLDAGGRVVNPYRLFTERAAFAPARIAGLLNGVRDLIGVGGDPGALSLPGGGLVALSEDGADLVLTVRFSDRVADPAGGTVGAVAALLVRISPGPAVRTSVSVAVRRTGDVGLAAAELELEAGAEVHLTARLTPLGANAHDIVIPLLPGGPGLGALAELGTTAATQILPQLLDALADPAGAGPERVAVANAVRAVGTALGLLDAGGFAIGQLRALADDPAGEFAARLRREPAAVIDAVRAVMAAAGAPPPPAPMIWRSANGAVAAALAATPTGPALTLTVQGVQPIDGIGADVAVTLTEAGLTGTRIQIAVSDPDVLLGGPVDLMPFVQLRIGDGVPDRVEAGLWLDRPAAAAREALLVSVPLAGVPEVLRRRTTATGTTDSADLVPALPGVLKLIAVPLVSEVVLANDAVADVLDGELGDALVEAGVLASGPWRLADGLLDHLLVRGIRAVAAVAGAFGGPAFGPFVLRLRTDSGAGVTPGSVRFGLGVRLTEAIEPPAVGGLVFAIEADADWDPPLPSPGTDHVELWIAEIPEDPIAPGAEASPAPAVVVRGLGLGVRAEQGPLIDTVLRLNALHLHAAYARDANGPGHAGARLLLDGLAVDLGAAAGGGNPVAGKVLSPGPGGGDGTPVAPGFSPELQILSRGGGPVGVSFRVGAGGGPWWIPIDRSFGPIYIAQIGLGVDTDNGDPVRVRLMLDGGASLAGLAVGVDDLALVIPWRTAGNPLTWGVDLAGLAIAYDNGSVTLAGGLRKLARNGGIEYIGMLALKAAGYGLSVIGAWGEFAVPDSHERYTSAFVFGALSAPIGGPPVFFVTGVGAGVGINRQLIIPADMAEVERFPLLDAMTPGSSLAQDPMGALDRIAATFPPARGAFWLAAGIRFTTFTVVESVAMLAVSVGDGVEVTILGRARMGLPNPAVPVVVIELLLKARFSSREGVLSIQAQLTSNSWLINESCRLTGGFAFVIWFRTGEMLLTLGGYHPHFDRPQRFPVVPRLGLAWQVSNVIVIKGESYLALTPTAVMTGMRVTVSFDGGIVQATFTAGLDAIISWDPSYYDLTIYVHVSARLQIEISLGFLGTIRITLGFEIGAEVHVWGPKLRGEALLQLDVARFSVPFGAREAPTGAEFMGFPAFHDKYLVSGGPTGEVMDVAVRSGQHQPEPGAPADKPDDGSADRPYRLQPEFTLTVETRMAANVVGTHQLVGLPLDIVPMGAERVTSALTVRVLSGGTEVHADRRPAVDPVTGSVPDGLWRLPEPGDMGADGVHAAFTGALVSAVPAAAADVVTGTIDDVESGPAHALPLRDTRDPGAELSAAMAAAAAWAASVAGDTALDAVAAFTAAAAFPRLAQAAIARCLGARTARTAAAGPSAFALELLAADRVAPPRLARITTGAVAPLSPPVAVTARPPVPPVPLPDPGSPRPAALLWVEPGPRRALPGRTTVGKWGARFARLPAPTMQQALAGTPPVAGHLHRMPPPLSTVAGPTGAALAGRDVAGRHQRVASRRERRLELTGDRTALLRLEKTLTGGGKVGLPAGQIQVWHVPRAGADVRSGRPVLGVDGDQSVRVVALGRTGTPYADLTLAAGSVEIPAGTQRIAVVGTGAPPPGAADPAGGLSGWYEGSVLARVSGDACLIPGGVLRARSAPATRSRTPVDAALIPGRSAVRAAGVVRTDLPSGTSCVLVVADLGDPARLDPSGTVDGLLLGLDGAVRPRDPSGAETSPLVVTGGTRVWMYFDVAPDGTGAPVRVTVGLDRAAWSLAGVLGAGRRAPVVADAVARLGIEALTRPLADRGPRHSTLVWTEGTP